MMFRGEVDGEPFLDGRTMLNGGNFQRQCVIYPVSREAMDKGYARTNWVIGASRWTTLPSAMEKSGRAGRTSKRLRQ